MEAKSIIPKGTKINWTAFVQYESNKDAFHQGVFVTQEDFTPEQIRSILVNDDYGHYDCRFVDASFRIEEQ